MELGAQQPHQNYRNLRIMWGKSDFWSRQGLPFRDIQQKLLFLRKSSPNSADFHKKIGSSLILSALVAVKQQYFIHCIFVIYRNRSDKPCQLTKFKGWSFTDSWHENVAVLMNSDNELSRKTEDLF